METIGSRHGLTREDLAVLPSFWRAGAELTVDRHSLEIAMLDSEDDAAEPAGRDMGNAPATDPPSRPAADYSHKA